jgi:hypothetical protein
MALTRLPRAPEYPKVDPGMQVRVRGGDDPWADEVGTLAGWLKGVSTVNARLKLTKEAGAYMSSRFFYVSTFNMALRRSDFTRAEEPAEEVRARFTIPRNCEGSEWWASGEEENEKLRFCWQGLLVNVDELVWIFALENFEPVPTTYHDVNDDLPGKLFRELATQDILSIFKPSLFSSVIPSKRSPESDEFTWKPSVELPMILSEEELEKLESGQL